MAREDGLIPSSVVDHSADEQRRRFELVRHRFLPKIYETILREASAKDLKEMEEDLIRLQSLCLRKYVDRLRMTPSQNANVQSDAEYKLHEVSFHWAAEVGR